LVFSGLDCADFEVQDEEFGVSITPAAIFLCAPCRTHKEKAAFPVQRKAASFSCSDKYAQ
jgi:hypothetical protein